MIILSGGTGTPKLLRGLRRFVMDDELTVIVNTAEDITISGGLVCPDIDTVLYLFAGILDEDRWWGIRGDTFHTHNAMKDAGATELLAIGDRDRATHLLRTALISGGMSLTGATRDIAARFGISARILPMSDGHVETIIRTPDGDVHFQDFWVGNRGEAEVLGVLQRGADEPGEEVLDAIEHEDTVVIGPSNPISSIGPILSMRGVREALRDKRVIAVSPMIGSAPVSGPAGKLLRAMGFEVSSGGVAQCYDDILDVLVIDERDTIVPSGGFEVVAADTLMDTREKSESLARFILHLLR
ncbi:MAG TPA: 2-phospho-L-lactate transferase [Candidatus Methanoperedenaceae archaeon]|nr:2-phospho-L-lactate transferase [Candidatus Methanoperedenaceae archaeon]